MRARAWVVEINCGKVHLLEEGGVMLKKGCTADSVYHKASMNMIEGKSQAYMYKQTGLKKKREREMRGRNFRG